MKTGFENIDPRAQYILSMDSDFVENIGQVRSLIKAMDQADGDGVIGSRFMDGSRLVNYPFLKRIMNRFFHIVVKALFSVRQNDLSNNFKLYKASVFKTLPWRSSDFAMNAETGLLPVLAGYRITEVPVWWVGRRPQMGRSKFSLFKNGASYARVIGTAWQFARARRRSSGRGVLP